MIRVLLSHVVNELKGYGFDVTGWENKNSESGYYNSLLEEDLIERVGEGDVLMYFGEGYSAKEWCDKHGILFEMIEPDDDNN